MHKESMPMLSSPLFDSRTFIIQADKNQGPTSNDSTEKCFLCLNQMSYDMRPNSTTSLLHYSALP